MAQEPTKLRVTVLKNGSSKSMAMVFLPSQSSLADVCVKASGKLCSPEDVASGKAKLTRVFTARGAEVSNVEEITANDVLFFSEGEDFLGEPQVSPRNIIKTIASNAANLATYGYGLTSSFVKTRAPIIGASLEKAETDVVRIASPLISSTLTYTEPYVAYFDSKLDVVIYKLDKMRVDFVEEYGPAVEKSFIQPVKDNVYKPAEQFFAHAYESYKGLRQSSGIDEKGATVVFSEYIIALRTRLGEIWNDKLLVPAKSIYDRLIAAEKKIEEDGVNKKSD